MAFDLLISPARHAPGWAFASARTEDARRVCCASAITMIAADGARYAG